MKEKGMKWALFVLSCVCAATFAVYSSANAQMKQNKSALNAVYQKSLFESAEMLSEMHLTIKKLNITSSKAMEIEYLSDISKQAQSIRENLSSLPVGAETVNNIMKFVNQVGDYSETLLKRLVSGGAVGVEDKENFRKTLEAVTELTMEAEILFAEYFKGKRSFDSFGTDAENDSVFSEPDREYPHLLYDGPFSDNSRGNEMRGIEGGEVGSEQAKEKLIVFFEGEAQKAVCTGLSGEENGIYEFTLEIGGLKAYAGVTRKGGKILYVLPEYRKFDEKIDENTLMEKARSFLSQKGMGEFVTAYYRKYDGVICVNLAPVQDGVILYPDLVKLEMDMENGRIIGIECSDYYKNHVRRDLPAPEQSEEDVRTGIGENLLVKTVRPCVIPLYPGERLAWEVHAALSGDEYLIYPDAMTGEEIKIYQLVHTPEGTIVQ